VPHIWGSGLLPALRTLTKCLVGDLDVNHFTLDNDAWRSAGRPRTRFAMIER
jgi:hypothetical protein